MSQDKSRSFLAWHTFPLMSHSITIQGAIFQKFYLCKLKIVNLNMYMVAFFINWRRGLILNCEKNSLFLDFPLYISIWN